VCAAVDRYCHGVEHRILGRRRRYSRRERLQCDCQAVLLETIESMTSDRDGVNWHDDGILGAMLFYVILSTPPPLLIFLVIMVLRLTSKGLVMFYLPL